MGDIDKPWLVTINGKVARYRDRSGARDYIIRSLQAELHAARRRSDKGTEVRLFDFFERLQRMSEPDMNGLDETVDAGRYPINVTVRRTG